METNTELAVWSPGYSFENYHCLILYLSPLFLQFFYQISACLFSITGKFWEWGEWKKHSISQNEFFKVLVLMLQVLHLKKKIKSKFWFGSLNVLEYIWNLQEGSEFRRSKKYWEFQPSHTFLNTEICFDITSYRILIL